MRNEEIEAEFQRGRKAQEDGNSGRVRVCARRAAGIALEVYYSTRGENAGTDAVQLLLRFSRQAGVPKEVQEAAYRLLARVTPDFESVSKEPLNDARLIIDFADTIR